MSESEEMYLVQAAMLKEDKPDEAIQLSRLAEALNVQHVSANQMVRKMADNGLFEYIPYKGVELTDAGRCNALNILRRRRLWQDFLVNHLGYDSITADHFACNLEHTLPDSAIDRLASFLGDPAFSPDGRPIPGCGNQIDLAPEGLVMSDAQVGVWLQITQVTIERDEERDFFQTYDLRPGAAVRILSRVTDGESLVCLANGKRMRIAPEILDAVWVFQINELQR